MRPRIVRHTDARDHNIFLVVYDSRNVIKYNVKHGTYCCSNETKSVWAYVSAFKLKTLVRPYRKTVWNNIFGLRRRDVTAGPWSQAGGRTWYKQLSGWQMFVKKTFGMIQASCLERFNASHCQSRNFKRFAGNDENCIDCHKLTKISGKIVVTFDICG